MVIDLWLVHFDSVQKHPASAVGNVSNSSFWFGDFPTWPQEATLTLINVFPASVLYSAVPVNDWGGVR